MTDTFLALPIKLDDKTKAVVCANHSLPTCSKCDLDLQSLNLLIRNFNSLPSDVKYPPPPNKQPPLARSAQIAKLKDAGNASFKTHKFEDAVRYYSLGVEMALARPPWEPAALCRDETVILLCNRSAAKFAMQAYPESLADAQAVVELKRPWAKGHYRKSKALQAMGRLEEAKKAIEMGLMYDPNDNECNLVLKDIKKALESQS
jgi:translocation protein SEC72